MQKGIQEVIQIFCPICSRGVIVRNESMFKCRQCDREVCRNCFDREERLCLECIGERKPHDLRRPKDQKPEAAERPVSQATGRDMTKIGIWLIVTGLTMFTAALLINFLVSIPTIIIVVAAAGALFMIVRGILYLLQ